MTRLTRIQRVLVAGLSVVGLATAVGLAARTAAPRPAQANPLAAGSTQIADVAERVVDSVVNISTTQATPGGPVNFDPFLNDPNSPLFGTDDPRLANSLGSGVIVSADGRVLTNAHVVGDARTIAVTLRDGTELGAKILGIDQRSDVAVLQLVPGKGKQLPALKPLPMGASGKVRLGEVVLAVGNPFGVGQAVTMGIVSAVGRASVGIEEYEDFIQTDAAINPGNSGGALVDMQGKLIGINTAILSRSGGYQGIGFAIPTDMARPIMDMLVADGRVSRGYLGVALAPVDQAGRDKLGVKGLVGVGVSEVGAGTPAAKAGLRPGDVITAMDGQPVREVNRLRNLVAMRGAGKLVRLDIVRGGAPTQVAVTLGELPERRVASNRLTVPRGLVPGPSLGGPSLGNRGLTPGQPQWRREEIIVLPDGRVERRSSSSDDPQGQAQP
ncbi:MAG: trypsin-like peptidase domain-containing protein [Kofleriaceae bacterium]